MDQFKHRRVLYSRYPMSQADLELQYQTRRNLLASQHALASAHMSRILIAIFALVILTFFLLSHARHNTPLLCSTGIAFLATIAAVYPYLRAKGRRDRMARLVSLYDRALERVTGKHPQSGRAGDEFRDSSHIYDRDLNLLGPDSLFGLLATTRTGPGERSLAHYLLQPATHQETLLRQQAVKELLPQNELREKIALLGTTSFQQIAASFFDNWLDDTPPSIHRALRPALALTAAVNIALLLIGFLHLISWSNIFPNLALMLCIQGILCLFVRPRLMPLLSSSARLQQNVRLIADGLILLQSTTLHSAKLNNLQRLSLQPVKAVTLLKQLYGYLTIVEQRNKEWYYIPSLFLAAGTQAAISIAVWKRQYCDAMRSWLDAWAEFEALNALATYSFEHPAGDGHNAWPQLLPLDDAPLYEAFGLGHPLLANPVTNNISLGPNCRFYLISGSNMSGKSTLLRSIGINAVLAYAGTTVPAQSLRLTPLALGASLSLIDSLAEGRSKFLAEVERLMAILNASAAAPMLFLVDEIFSGTNSEDRRTAARKVLERLLANQAIGALSTHDLALTQLATPANTGCNVHMASPHPEDPLAFDYTLKPGVNTASSARAILHLIGIDT